MTNPVIIHSGNTQLSRVVYSEVFGVKISDMLSNNVAFIGEGLARCSQSNLNSRILVTKTVTA